MQNRLNALNQESKFQNKQISTNALYVSLVDIGEKHTYRIRNWEGYLKDLDSLEFMGYKLIKTFKIQKEIAQCPDFFHALDSKCKDFSDGEIPLNNLEKSIEDLIYYFGNTAISN